MYTCLDICPDLSFSADWVQYEVKETNIWEYMSGLLGKLDKMVFSAIIYGEQLLVTSCLLSYTSNPFWKRIYSKRKEFAPLGANSYHLE